MKHDHQQQVQRDIQRPRQGKEKQRLAGVPLGAENRVAEIIQRQGGHAQKINAQV